MDNKTKEVILDRIYEKVGLHKGGMTVLPEKIDTDTILEAINIDEYFFKEEQTNET